MPDYDILVGANYSIDLVFTGLAQFPALGEDTGASGFGMIPGESFTPAVALHRLGLKTGWAADFGSDDLSRWALARVAEEGLDQSLFIHHDRSLRRLSVAVSFPHDRAFITYYDPDPEPPALLRALQTVTTRALYLPGLCFGLPFDAIEGLLIPRQTHLIMDGNIGSSNGANLTNPDVRRAIARVDAFLPNAREARLITGVEDLPEALRILAAICPIVVIKDGLNGSYTFLNGSIIHVPAIKVTPLDTTGAGDVFSCGFSKAWLDGKPLAQCLRWGNIAGGLSTLGWGGTGYRVTDKTVEEWA
jgi:sugar/nucleoside kinase (ribokinase family)